ncbi:sensor histidine kinase [Streptomyces varsoviensis]|uniref:sensor histidine kinase n=1 Tax=Streptomyces varsoviensis TaxID=67373 RepID=UPI0004C5E39B|nr:ATP-binding protein [Streptomyces varsoviensis]
MSAHISTRQQAVRPPVGQALLVLLAAAVVTGGLCLWAALAAPVSVRTPVAWGGGAAAALLSLSLAMTAHSVRTARARRDQIAALEAEAGRLADDTLPALVAVLRRGSSVDTALAHVRQPADGAHQRIVRILAEEVGRGERMRAAAMSACANAAGRVQALATSMLADLREMEHRHGEEVLGDLLKLDHSTAQAGRLADSIAVLTGARSGRRWTKPIAMESILRGAMGRISAYRRVRLHSSSTAAVAGHAAEGIMHALAEIMDNATTFSPPSSEAHVYVEEAQAGVVITVEDGGLVMSEAALRRAEQAVSSETLDLLTLSGTRLGLAVVGCLARKHGLSVSFRPSSRGGTGVVILIPQQLVTQQATARPAPAQAAPAQHAPAQAVPAPHAPAHAPAQQSAPRHARTPATPGRTPLPEAGPMPPAAPAQAPAAPAQQPPAPVQRPVQPPAHQPVQQRPAPAQAPPPAPLVGDSGLPKRRRGQTLAAAPSPTPSRGDVPPPARSNEEAAARFSTFRRAVQGNSDTANTPTPARPEDDPR